MLPLIRVLEWAAFAQDMTTQESWLQWARQTAPSTLAALEQQPSLEKMPAILRRRASLTARLAAHVAYAVNAPNEAPATADADIPLVFASRYGDAQRALALLANLVQGEPLSPTGFGLSVHNAVGALYAMACGNTANMVVITAGENTLAAAFTEVMACLADGAPEVVLVSYDAPLPAPYTAFHPCDMPEHAWAIRVAIAPPNTTDAISVQWRARHADAAKAPTPQGSTQPLLANASLDAVRQVLRCMDGHEKSRRIVL